MPKYVILLILFCLSCAAYAQKENNIWYFGKNAGLDFNGGAPVPLTNGSLNTWEGCASVADPVTGNLLFYTNGEYVYNKNHFIMPNGTGLWGQFSSTQSALIVPKPGSASLYYIFTTDAGTGGFPNFGIMGYSMVDMNLAGGLGDVTLKNFALFDTTSEQLTSTLHADGCKVWVLAHKWMSDEFYAYLVSDSGVSAPVISSSGSIHSCTYFGQMKISPDGSKLALPLPCDSANNSIVELFDFDNSTGIVSNSVMLPHDHMVYGLEFSPSSQFLYTADINNSAAIMYKQISQYDVTLGSAAAINASRIIVGAVWNTTTFFTGAAQLGPDGKIYIAPTDKDSLCVINNPDAAGLACNFVVAGLYIINQCDHGLPGKVVTAQYPCAPPVALFTGSNHICPGTCTSFSNLSLGATSYTWNFNGAVPSVSSAENPDNICYSAPGVYSVSLIATNAGGSDTLTLNNFITVYPYPPPQSITQSGDTLFALSGAQQYQWYLNGDTIPGATDYFHIALSNGNYNVVATDTNGCQVEAAFFDVMIGYALLQNQLASPHVVVNENDQTSTAYFEGSPGIASTTLYDALGHATASWKVQPQSHALTIHTGNLAPGIYFLHLQGIKNYRLKFCISR